jgi:hypothetical protein
MTVGKLTPNVHIKGHFLKGKLSSGLLLEEKQLSIGLNHRTQMLG